MYIGSYIQYFILKPVEKQHFAQNEGDSMWHVKISDEYFSASQQSAGLGL
jgi:hypothetical protein